jgi:hypothetical protein
MLIKKAGEIAVAAAILLLSFHLVYERIHCTQLPDGDEGSWMSVSAQLMHGEGFTTRWLEFPFLPHPDLPRPDDFRYPALTLILAAVFTVFGCSYMAALWTVGTMHLMLVLLVFLVCRKKFGSTAAIITMLVVSVSLLQLYWNTKVYTEALSGLCIGCLVWWAECTNRQKKRYPVVLGMLLGFMYLIRPNGILMAGGLLFMYGWNLRETAHRWKSVGIAAAVMLLVMLPWLVRTAYYFNNPFHFANSGGIFRASATDPLNLGAGDFFDKYGIFIIVKATLQGTIRLFDTLNFFEHSLHILPLAGFAACGIVYHKRISPMILSGLLLTFTACCYIAYNGSWAGVRYLASFLPWMYMYGIVTLLLLLDHFTRRFPIIVRKASAAFLAVVLIAPVVLPHEYYERTLPQKPAHDPAVITTHIGLLTGLLNGNDTYCAGHVMSQLNFLTRFNCVGLQDIFDSTYVPWTLRTFSPSLIVLTDEEIADSRIQGILYAFKREGVPATEVQCINKIHYLRVAGDDQGNQAGSR